MIRNGHGFSVANSGYFRYSLKNTGIGIGRWRVFKPQIKYNPKNLQRAVARTASGTNFGASRGERQLEWRWLERERELR